MRSVSWVKRMPSSRYCGADPWHIRSLVFTNKPDLYDLIR